MSFQPQAESAISDANAIRRIWRERPIRHCYSRLRPICEGSEIERGAAMAYRRVAAMEGIVLVTVFVLLSGLMPALAQSAGDVEYVLRSNGISCVRSPCPVVDATEVATGRVTMVTDIDVGAVAVDAQREALATDVRAGAYVVTGRVERRGERLYFVVQRVVRRAPGGPP